MARGRAIGPLGTLARIAVGLGLFALALVPDGVEWTEVALGLAGFPAALLLAQAIRLRFDPTPLRATDHLGFCLNAVVLALLLVATPTTHDAALLWLGASMLLAAWRGYAGCESLAISNWLLRREDQVGCLLFSPLDAIEARTGRGNIAR